MDRNPASILLYSHDGVGLGHLRRNALIARRLVREWPEVRALLLTGHQTIPFFPLPQGMDFVKLPSIQKVDTGLWQARTLGVGQVTMRAFRAGLIQQCAEQFQPDLFLVDYTPTGVWGELLPTLQLLKARDDPATIVLGLRPILDAPQVTRTLWEREGVYEVLQRYYDRILIYGSRDCFDTAAAYGLEGELARKVQYCGYLCSDDDDGTPRPEQARALLQLAGMVLLVVTAGGGADAFPMMRVCLQALRHLNGPRSVEMLLICGPLMQPEERAMLKREAAGLRVRILPHVQGTRAYLSAADLIITMGGYNSLMDALQVRKPTVVIPRAHPSAEQQMAARLFADMGLVTAVDPVPGLSPDALAAAIRRTLVSPPVPRASLKMDGLDTVAAILGTLLAQRRLREAAGTNGTNGHVELASLAPAT